jgi:hypothetical protein
MREKFGGELGKKQAYEKMIEKREWAEKEISAKEIRKRIKEIATKGR